MNRWFAAVLLMVVGAIVVNLAVLNIVSFNQASRLASLSECDKYCVMNLIDEKLKAGSSAQPATVLTEAKKELASPSCDAVCVEKIVRRVVPEMISKSSTPSPVVKKSTPTPTAVARDYLVRVPDASVMASAWTQAASTSTTMDVYLYGSTLVASRWEGWLELVGGSGKGYARLYDLTNHRVVDGSEVTVTGSARASFYSGNLSLWRGQNQYVVEMRTDSGSEIKISGAQIKLVMK